MLFRTRSEFEFKFGTSDELLGDPPGTQHWRAHEWAFDDLWFIIEFVTKEGIDEERTGFWKTINCTELMPILDLARSENVLDHRISLVIPNYARPNGQIELKPVQIVNSCGNDAYEVITSDSALYTWPKDNTPSGDGKTKIYFKPSVNQT